MRGKVLDDRLVNDGAGVWPGRLARLVPRRRAEAAETVPLNEDMAAPLEALRAQLAEAGYPVERDAAPDRMLSLLLASFEELTRTNDELEQRTRALAEAEQRERTTRARADETAERLEQLVHDGEAARRQRHEAIATMAHDLKNPLGTIFTSAAMLLEMPLDEEQRTRQLQIIRRTAERMNRMIQEQVDLSRIEAGTFVVDMVPERADTIVTGAVEQLDALAASRHVQLESGNEADGDFVLADGKRVLQVFSTLIGNALERAPSGSAISVRGERTGDAVTFTIENQAPPIPAEQLSRFFDRSRSGGGGPGLAIAKGIVRAHGGEIGAENAEGGTRIHFTLPIVPHG